jgi:hypothetical protein
MRRHLGLLIFLIFIHTGNLSAQSMGRTYKTALGVKFSPGAVSLKHFTRANPKMALEGLGYFWDYGTRLTALLEFHQPISGAPGLQWYVGPGAHLGFWNTRWKDRYRRDGGTYFGVDGVLGLDYKFNKAPINASVDWQPSFSFGDGEGYGFLGNWGGISLRYTF